MSAGGGLRRRRRGYARQGYGRGRRYGRPYSRRRSGGGSCRRAAGGAGALNMFARLGFAARGIAYIVIGVIAVMMAFGVARHEPDRAGAIEAIAVKPFWIPAVVDPGHRVPRNGRVEVWSRPRCGG